MADVLSCAPCHVTVNLMGSVSVSLCEAAFLTGQRRNTYLAVDYLLRVVGATSIHTGRGISVLYGTT